MRTATLIPDAFDRHLVSRFSFGWSADLAERIPSGGARAWFESQLVAEGVADDYAASMIQWFPSQTTAPRELWRQFQADQVNVQSVADDLGRWTILRQIHSARQVKEVMSDFWSNLLYVPSPNDKSWPVRANYDRTIRRNALGSFDTLLAEAVLHPALLCYLDNWDSTALRPNENLGRELLELFTVGRSAAYSEQDVWNSAMILTGWTVSMRDTWLRKYLSSTHYVGQVQVMGFSSANRLADGRPIVDGYLRYLAHHPTTARRIARRLAVRFVDDNPTAALVDSVAAAYLASGTDIKATLRALVDHPDFAQPSSIGAKVRTPIEDYAATTRALGVRALAPTGSREDMSDLCIWQALSLGQRPFGWPRPDGFPDNAQVWSSATRLLGSWQLHQTLASGTHPSSAVRYEDHATYMPGLPLPFPEFVDEVSRRLLHRPADPVLVRAAADATGSSTTDVVTSRHTVVRYSFVLLLTALLDSTHHMTR